MKQFLYMIFVSASMASYAQIDPQRTSFSLNEAIEHALQYNYTVVNANKDIAIAQKKKWETTAMGLPQIDAGLDYQNNIEIQKSVVPAGIFGGKDGDFAEVAFGTRHSMLARTTLSQLIFDGSYIVALQASKTYLRYYQNNKSKTDIDIKEMIINSYGNVLLAKENVIIIEKNIASLEKTLSDTKQTFKNGLIEEETVEQLQINLTNLTSTLQYNKRLLDITYKMLKINMGIDISKEITLTDQLDNLTAQNLDLALAQNTFEVKENINYKIASNYQEQKTLEYKLQKTKALPSLGANVNFGYNAFGNQFQFFTPNQKWLNYSNVGLSLHVPIFSSFARSAKTQQAKIALEQANIQLLEAEQRLKLQHAAAKSDYEYSIEDYLSAKTNLNLAERIEKKQQIKFTEGLSTSFDFNDAQRQLYSSQQKYLQSMIAVINKKASLEKITSK